MCQIEEILRVFFKKIFEEIPLISIFGDLKKKSSNPRDRWFSENLRIFFRFHFFEIKKRLRTPEIGDFLKFWGNFPDFIFLPFFYFFSPRGGFSQGAKETLGSQEAGCSRDTAYIIYYITLSMSVDALDEAASLTFGSKEIFGGWLYIIKELPLLFMRGPRG